MACVVAANGVLQAHLGALQNLQLQRVIQFGRAVTQQGCKPFVDLHLETQVASCTEALLVIGELH